MPMRLEGSCRCSAISFSVDSHTPYPYQRCYCSICRKSAGGGGYAARDQQPEQQCGQQPPRGLAPPGTRCHRSPAVLIFVQQS